MEFDTYQDQALETERVPNKNGPLEALPFIGLAGETGELLNEYKKHLREGAAHQRFRERVAEELGDILWYLSNVASKYRLRLSDIADQNLTKTRGRWLDQTAGERTLWGSARQFDATFPPNEQLPRQFVARFFQYRHANRARIRVEVNGIVMGQELTDNAHREDGYRFHDVFHLACAAVLGWSPVTRRNLRCKRRSDPHIDEVEDGGRAIVTEEGISALVFAYASDHAALKGLHTLDYDILKAIKVMTAKFEVAVCSTSEWEKAIFEGYRVWDQVAAHEGGNVIVDLDQRSLQYQFVPAAAREGEPLDPHSVATLKTRIKALHREKDAAYSGAWKRRGELMSILPNILRKVDRIEVYQTTGAKIADESVLDTAIDLLVYILKYRLFLMELSPAGSPGELQPDAPIPLSDHPINFDALLDPIDLTRTSTLSLENLTARLLKICEELYQSLAATPEDIATRIANAQLLIEIAAQILRIMLVRSPAQ